MNRTFLILLAIACLATLPPTLLQGQEGPEQEAKLVQKAQELAGAKQFEQAVATMNKALQFAPRNDLYLAMTSEYEYKAGAFAAGLEHARKAIQLNNKVGAYYVLASGNAYANQDLDVAREYCEEILSADPKSSAPRHARMLRRCRIGW